MYYAIHNIIFRRLNSGTSNLIDTTKLQLKNVVLNQWKLITVLKSYISKYTKDKTFEKAINKEFLLFLQKIDLKAYGDQFIRSVVSNSIAIQNPKDKQDETSSVLPSVLNGLKVAKEKEVKVTKVITPKWKAVPKSVISRVSTFCRVNWIYHSTIISVIVYVIEIKN